MQNETAFGHFIALITMLIWGATYISTKLILTELSPIAILGYRFLIGYIALWVIYPKLEKFRNFKEELLFIGLGLTGIFLYYLIENIALQYTLAANVGLLIALAPILTAIIAHLTTPDEKISLKLILGFFIAMIGVFLVIFNGRFVLKINPIGDLLALLAAVVWSIYSILLKKVDPKRNQVYIVRKTFFYGLIMIFPVMFFLKSDFKVAGVLQSWSLLANILFLGLAASAFCFVTWNKAVKLIGVISASNYIYLVPLITMLTSIIILHEKVNGLMILGGFLILGGVYLSENNHFKLGFDKLRKQFEPK